MKRIIPTLLLMTSAITANAQTALIVHEKSGSKVEYAFSERPVVTYRESYLIISANESTVEYPVQNLSKFTFGTVTDMVTRVVAAKDKKALPTQIYNVSGILVRTLPPVEDGTTPASVDGLPGGTYIIKNGTTSYKIHKK